ncbi:hypothetical protein [Antarcticirhabdus aurantiaca]|uniref:Uncharacterized protein n=1 Tax=Antarcticirhabdus aurantiaca TaxID=2606717 RepID=A0ACD4NUJ0_9HYPH|nr:hypothetical protein [Antarcticirhabdus aurantiaca]WAJ30494.1 hypothetical protein OXU80_09945 [Jeongeuplla avenae]
MAISSRAIQTINAFAASMGVEAAPAADGSYSFVFQRSGTLTLTAASEPGRVLVSLAARPQQLDERLEGELIQLAGPDPSTGRLLSVGVGRGGHVIFAVGLDDDEMDLPAIETCLRQLMAARAVLG